MEDTDKSGLFRIISKKRMWVLRSSMMYKRSTTSRNEKKRKIFFSNKIFIHLKLKQKDVMLNLFQHP